MVIMKLLALVILLLVSLSAAAGTTTLVLPGNTTLIFDAPEMTKVKEASDGSHYQYVATSLGGADERFNLSVYVEPIDCQYGKSLRDVARCFTDRLASTPGIATEEDSPSCSRKRCDIFYVTTDKSGEKQVRQLHVNSLFIYLDTWVDVHFSVVDPNSEDSKVMARFAATLKFMH
jgi:hypothetical protein